MENPVQSLRQNYTLFCYDTITASTGITFWHTLVQRQYSNNPMGDMSKLHQHAIREELSDDFHTDGMNLLRDLVNQNSYTLNTDGVNLAQEIVSHKLAELGLEVEHYPLCDPNEPRGNIITASSPLSKQNDGKGDVILSFHSDTVHHPDSPFKTLRLKDSNTLEGPGAYDMKASLVSAYLATRLLKKYDLLDNLPLRMIINSAEENSSEQSREMIRKLAFGANRALVFEFGRGDNVIVTERYGFKKFIATAKGQSAHVREYAEGVNAIEEIAQLTLQLKALREAYPDSIINQGKIRGGSDTLNRVPDFAELRWEMRAASRELLDELTSQTMAADQSMDERAEITICEEKFISPMESSPATQELFQNYTQAGALAGVTFSAAPKREHGLSDGNILSTVPLSHDQSKTIPVIDALGANGYGAHTEKESVYIDSIIERTHALVAYLAEYELRS